MIKMNYVAAALLPILISVAHAETPKPPTSQGDASVDKNLRRDPDNKGLQTADKRLEANEAKNAARHKHKKASEEKHEQKAANHERMERNERMERPERPQRGGSKSLYLRQPKLPGRIVI